MKTKVLCLYLLVHLGTFAQISNTKPYTRWWWMGSAVSEEGIKYNLEQFAKAGLGGVEITPIYGVKGEEKNFLPFLSESYIEKLNFTTKIADSLGIDVDMVLGTGWPYGGPQVEPEYAATKLRHERHEVSKGQLLNLEFETTDDQPLIAALAVDGKGNVMDISSSVQINRLIWPSSIDGQVYLFFTGKTGQQVKRAAPGGEGFTVDHYSKAALEDYLEPYNKKLNASIRAVFNDSYEVYNTDFTPNFLSEFKARRGYDLSPYLPALVEKENNENINRVRADYRRTLSDLLKEDFNETWTQWAHGQGYLSKLQAHGSPGNLLDQYATADIPECETFGSMPFDIPGFRREADDIREGDANPVMLKFSSSAAHVMGKPLVSSESFTWLRDHFKTALSQTKPELEELFLNGVNHIFLHGSTYSPPTAEWPGWKFYASVNFSPQMTIWNNASMLFQYIENCQEYLRKGAPNNEIGVYWPVEDVYHKYLDGRLFYQFNIHALEEWLLPTPFYKTNRTLIEAGFQVDFFSDAFVSKARVENGELVLPGGRYKALVIPETTHMPIATLQKLLQLKSQGAQIFFENKPSSVPGNNMLAERENTLQKLVKGISITPIESLTEQLIDSKIIPEVLTAKGLKFIRRNHSNQYVYFIVNHTSQNFDGWLPLQYLSGEATFIDPQNGEKLLAHTQQNQVYLQLKAGESIIIETNTSNLSPTVQYVTESKDEHVLEGPYELTFLKGGPQIPQSHSLKKLISWTSLGKEAEAFSGTAKYSIAFDSPDPGIKSWRLKLPDVRESARIFLNGKEIDQLWFNPFETTLENLKDKGNLLEIEVTNLAANRIRAKELRGEEWKIFYEINMVNKDYQKFDATLWQPMPSGLIGEIKLVPLEVFNPKRGRN